MGRGDDPGHELPIWVIFEYMLMLLYPELDISTQLDLYMIRIYSYPVNDLINPVPVRAEFVGTRSVDGRGRTGVAFEVRVVGLCVHVELLFVCWSGRSQRGTKRSAATRPRRFDRFAYRRHG